MSQLFENKPHKEYADYSLSHINKGADYHEGFVSRPGRALMWELEKKVLRGFLDIANPSHVLDFACGTGRITEFLSRELPETEVRGIDISESMLKVARQYVNNVKFHQMDSRRALEYFEKGYFDFISAFRFFANADRALCEDSAAQISELIAPGGWFVFNNHRNFWSLSYMGSRLMGRPGFGEVNGRLERLFTSRGFVCIKRFSLGVWPQTETKSFLFPWHLTRKIEQLNFSFLGRVHSIGYNMIWLMQKKVI